MVRGGPRQPGAQRRVFGLPDAKLHGNKGRKVRGKERLLEAKFPGGNISHFPLPLCPPLRL